MVQDEIAKLANQLINDAEAKEHSEDAVVIISQVDGKVSVAVGGTSGNIVRLIASAIQVKPLVGQILDAGVKYASIAGQLQGGPCNCEKCVERRRQANAGD